MVVVAAKGKIHEISVVRWPTILQQHTEQKAKSRNMKLVRFGTPYIHRKQQHDSTRVRTRARERALEHSSTTQALEHEHSSTHQHSSTRTQARARGHWSTRIRARARDALEHEHEVARRSVRAVRRTACDTCRTFFQVKWSKGCIPPVF